MLRLETREAPRDHFVEMSVNGRSPADLTEMALRSALFGLSNPLTDQHLGFMAEMSDPLEALRAARVPDEIARPLAELMVVDALVGSGRAVRVTDFRLGANVRGGRRLSLAWETPRQYSSERATTKRIEGDVHL